MPPPLARKTLIRQALTQVDTIRPPCAHCNGTGQVGVLVERDPFMLLIGIEMRGEIVSVRCGHCNGTGSRYCYEGQSR